MKATQLINSDTTGVARAAAILQAGGLVAVPTETVYGLAGAATMDSAVAGIYAAKGRPSSNPLIVHVPDLDTAQRYALFDDQALALAQAFWPGPLTLVLPIRPDAGLAAAVTAGNDTVAIRVPAHPLARALLRASGLPLAAPSANPSGKISPTTATHVMEGLNGRIDAVLDGGACAVGLESTIIAPGPVPRLLRPGGVSVEAAEAVLRQPLALPGQAQPARLEAPGQMLSHYAPDAPVRLNITAPDADEVYIGFGPDHPGVLTLSATGDLDEAARVLFDMLRQADRMGSRIAIAPIPRHGLGLAINDRLARAAAPRP